MEEKWMTSVGIDVGTSTTKLIVSRLRLARVTGRTAIPKYQIVERELSYASPIYPTPLKNRDEIDVDQIHQILAQEYQKARLSLSDVKSGAVIITGETATKTNAERLVHYLAERAGDFVVATAGADLEGVMAGRGAGAQQRSLRTKKVVANIDIGGGTANAAYFQEGRVLATVTFHVGGRLVQLDGRGYIQSVSPQLRPWLTACGYDLAEGRMVSFSALQDILSHLNRTMLDYVTGAKRSGESGKKGEMLILGDPPVHLPHPDEVMISGGVGQLMLEKPPQNLAETAIYQDVGPLLAHTLLEECKRQGISLIPAVQTSRATVIGAGMESTEISGSTVYLDPALLPLRNLPVCKGDLGIRGDSTRDEIAAGIHRLVEQGNRLYGQHMSPPFAIALGGIFSHSYQMLQMLADELVNAYQKIVPSSTALIVICENDVAKALGQTLAVRTQGKWKIICIDQIQVEHGDYVDLGEPIANAMIPVMIKTLVFPAQVL